MYFYLFFSYQVQVAAPYHVTFVRSFTKYTAISRKVVGKSACDNPERYCEWF